MITKLKKKRVLIFGNTGFVGSWLSLSLNLFEARVLGVSLKMKNRADKCAEKCSKREACKAIKESEKSENENYEASQENKRFNLSKLKFKFKKSKKDSISDSSPAE